jgi:cytochrome c553
LKNYILPVVLLLLFAGCKTDTKTFPVSPETHYDTPQKQLPIPVLTIKEKEEATELFKICEVCHGKYAQLHALDVSHIIADWNSSAIKNALIAYKTGTRDTTGNGYVMEGEVQFLNETEIDLISKYIPTLNTMRTQTK